MAATQLFINVAARAISSSLVRSLTDMTPVAFPELVIGDGRAYELYFVDGAGGYAAFSGDGSYIPYIAIGTCGFPAGGTAKWTFNGQQTAALAYNISPAALQTALEALSSIGAGNVSVAGVAGKYYVITFIGTLGHLPQPEVTVDFAGLTPASTVDISTIVAGSASPATNAVQLATLATNPLTFADDWTPITNGWTGSLSARTLEIFEAFAAAGGTLNEIFQVTVANADGVRTTYAKVASSIQCTVISPESFAGSDKPLLATQAALNAAVLGLNNFTREALSSAATGNTNVTRPATSSRHHLARIAISGAAGIRTISLLTTNSPNPGDFILLALLPGAVAGYELKVYNATTGGTLLADITTTAAGIPFFLAFSWSGSAWELDLDASTFLAKAENLSGLADTVAAKANLRSIFSRISNKSADFTIVAADEGTLFRVSAGGGPVEATLPAANSVSAGFMIGIQKYDAGPQIVTSSPATKTLATGGASMILQSDGNSWGVVLAYDPTNVAPTLAEVIENKFAIDSLTTFRAQVTAGGVVETNAAWWVPVGTGGIWVLEDDNSADNGINIIRPDDHDDTTNPRSWHLLLRGAPAAMTTGDIMFFNGTDLVVLPIGTAAQFLRVNGGATAPEWTEYVPPAVTEKVEQTLTAGDIDIEPTAPIHSEIITIAGTARTSVITLAELTNAADGWLVKLRLAFPATAGIVVEIRDDASGNLIATLTSDDGGGSAYNLYLELVYVEGGGGPGSQDWKLLFLTSPTV